MYRQSPTIFHTLGWSALDAVTVNTALLIFEYALSRIAGSTFHGIFGTVISVLYIMEGITNFGFDGNLAAYISRILSSRKQVWRFFRYVWLPHLAWIICVAISLYIYGLDILLGRSLAFVYPAWMILFLIEAVRKTQKNIVRYMGYLKATAIIEIAATFLFTLGACTLVVTQQHSLPRILYLHSSVTLLQSTILTLYMAYYVWKLPSVSHASESVPLLQLHVHRLFVGINEFAGILYTGSFLIPFIAESRGYEFASIFRLVSYTARWFVIGMQQVFAVTGNIVLAQQKGENIQKRLHTFYTLTHYLHQVLYAGIFFVIMNSWWLFVPRLHIQFTPWQCITIGFFIFALTLIDNFCAFYLRWYIIEEKALHIAACNLVSILAMETMLRYLELGDMITIIAMCSVRLLSFVMISAWSFYIWGLRPSLRWEKESIAIAVCASLAWLLIHVWHGSPA